jgi:putative transposase
MSRSIGQILVHIIFATRRREQAFRKESAQKIESYLIGIANNIGGRTLAVGVEPEHCHLLAEIPASMPVSEFAGKIKANSSRFAKTLPGVPSDFTWQQGYMALSVSPGGKMVVMDYINSQEEHHKEQSFEEERAALLRKFGLDPDAFQQRR